MLYGIYRIMYRKYLSLHNTCHRYELYKAEEKCVIQFVIHAVIHAVGAIFLDQNQTFNTITRTGIFPPPSSE